MTLNNRKSVWDFVQPGCVKRSAQQAVAADTAILAGEWSGINTPLTADELRAADELVLGVFDAAHQLDDGRNSTEALRPLFSMHAAQSIDSIAAVPPSTLPDEVTPPVDQPGDLPAPDTAAADEPVRAKRPRKTWTKKKGQPAPEELVDDGTVSTTPTAPWAPEDRALIASLHGAAWKVVDVETTELTPGSPPLKATSVHGLTAWQKSKVNTQPRLRIVTATWPTDKGLRTESWDMDTLSADYRQRLAKASLTGTFVAHNAAFDLTWLVHAAGGPEEAPRPERVIDTLIFARIWSPDQQAALTGAADDDATEGGLAEAVDVMLGNGRKGGWSLEAHVMAHLHKTLDKTLQKPRNWLPPPPLSDAHYQYAAGDSTELLELINVMLAGLGHESEGLAGWLEAYTAWVAEEGRRAAENREPQAPGLDGGAEQLPATDLITLYEQVPWLLAAMTSRGTPADVARKDAYVESQKVAAREAAARLVAVAPELADFEGQLADIRQGQSAALKQVLGEAFVKRGLAVTRTEKTNQYQVGQKDLRGAGATQSEATRPLFEALVATYNASRRASMAEDMFAHAARADGRVHSLFSPKTSTLRLSSSEPNCFTGDTEILTPRGWVRFEDLADAEPVAQYAHGVITFVTPTATIRAPFTGELVRNLVPEHIDLLTTPGHRCLLIHRKTGEERVYQAVDYKEDHLQLHAGAYPGGPGLPLSDDEIRFLVATQADGSFTQAGGLDFSFYKARKIERFGQLTGMRPRLMAQPGRHRVHLGKTHPLTKLAREYLGTGKRFGQWVLQMTRAQLDVFLAELSCWDGLYTRRDSSVAYTTTVRENADWVQALYALSGTRVTVRPYWAPNSKHTAWRVGGVLNRNYSLTTNCQQERQFYSGLVYCVSVPSSYIVVRRNGRVMITGQSQQQPSDELFRAITRAREGHKIVACDFSALDVRVGAALAVRAQHQVFAANGENRFDWQGLQTVVSAPVARQVEELSQWPSAQLAREATRKGEALWDMLKARKAWREARERGLKQGLDDAALRAQSPYGKILGRYEEAAQKFTAIEILAHWDRICTEVQARGADAFSPLRQAFLFGADIHTYTALLLQNRNPEEILAGLEGPALKARLKELKGELGDARKEGKVANLSLLYGMSAYGFQHHAASLWDIHWTKEEAEKLRDGWLNAYVEIAFFAAVVRSHEWLPRPWECHTLTGRVLYAPAYSAALNHPDQGTGADIALAAMARLDAQYPEVGACLINQVHDELVLEAPAEKAEGYARILHDVMVEEGNRVLMPYGVPMAAEYVIADEWQKG